MKAKTARFQQVVAKSGKPTVYLAFSDPAKDQDFQALVKANRIMTVMQEVVGSAADKGTVGFEGGPNRQFLVFPKSLRTFSGKGIVGIKYDLLDPDDQPGKAAKKPAEPSKVAQKAAKKPILAKQEAPKPSTARLAKPQLSKNQASGKNPKIPALKPDKKTTPASGKAPTAKKVSVTRKIIPFQEASPEKHNKETAEIKKLVRRAMQALQEGKQLPAFNLLKRIMEL